jgi:serine protease inhibitor
MRISAFALCALLAACSADSNDRLGPDGRSPTDTVRAFTVQEREIARANTAFGLNLMRTVGAERRDGNLLLSPLSLSMALGMTLNGAAGTTFSAMRGTLGFEASLQQPQINAAYNGLIRQLRARDPKVEFALANSIWYEQTFPVYATFIDTVRHYFDAEVRALNFRDPASPRTISQWAEQKTGGRIKDLVQSIDPLEIMFLVNAVYFKAPWSRPFQPNGTVAAPFRRPDGSTVSAQIMNSDGPYNHIMNDRVHAVELLYADSAYSMVLVMPAQGTSLDAITSVLESGQWEGVMSGMRSNRIMLRVPKFRFDYEKELTDPLTSLGMGIAFRPFQADFTKIANRDDIHISRVQHKSFIDVHELGTEAAAATAVGVGVTSLPPELTFDRPFFFAIRERSTGTLLFIGRITDPAA